MFMIEYTYESFAHTNFSFYRVGSSLEHIRERLSVFIVSEVISLKGEFYFKL
jgi:hypothetical protein